MDKAYKISNYKYRSPTKTAKLQEHVVTFKAHMAIGLKGCQCRHCAGGDCTQCAMAIMEGLF